MKLIIIISLVLLTACHHTTASTQQNQNQNQNSTTQSALIDINAASKADLEALPGIGDAYAQKIIDNRPYREKTDLVRLKIIPESTYKTIADKIIAHHKQ